NIAVDFDSSLLGVEKDVTSISRFLQFVRRAAPSDRCGILEAGMKRPITDYLQTMARRKAVLHPAHEPREALRVAQDDALLLASLERKDAHLERAAIDPLQQGGVSPGVHDLLEHLTSVIALGHAIFHELAVHIHSQP